MNTERPAYLTKIDLALESRQGLAEFLEVGLSEVYSKTDPRMKKWIGKLRNTESAEELLGSTGASTLLPVLLRYARRDMPGLRRDAKILLRTPSLPTRTWSAFVSYPVIVLAVTMFLFLMQAYWISPVFEQMFREFQLRLPPITRWVFAVNRWTRDYILVFSILVIAGLLLWGSIRVFGAGILDRLQLFRPIGWLVSGNRRNLLSMSRFLQTLAELNDLGATDRDAIHLAAASESDWLRRNAERLIDTVERGATERDSGERDRVGDVVQPVGVDIPFPPLLIQTLRAESDPRAPDFLRALADSYRTRAEIYFDCREQAASPWTVLLIGSMVLMLILALFLPLVSLITALS
ncbi:type IV pilin biogenesis protein [Pirellula sp. SH-Sr6A]|uniref:type II secretion system F family protein n=1 Tax=Pirellula sp. SH-Sr6A TaxID=1632865 RepID=UPI00078E5465|nr:type II secretion system F family protein [Pirellula sp. SH-Sr6A]AMV32414.1 type IV pilin biogenesis protein [Pirellula sp. SH-Sr6A]